MKDNQQIRFGILGCAEISRKMARAIRLAPNADLVAIGSRSLDKARRFAADNGLLLESVTCYGSYDEVLDDGEVDAVYVPLPTSLHIRWAAMAAEKGKHVLLEKPTALHVTELDRILAACEARGVQFKDATMWMHHPRTAKMWEILSDGELFGKLQSVYSSSTFAPPQEFLENNIRVKPDLDALGALGDAGWYCIRAILWAVGYQLPKTITATPAAELNQEGVILSCGASLAWEDSKVATFFCSFLAHESMDVTLVGDNGALHMRDFIIPCVESSASFTYSYKADFGFRELQLQWNKKPDEIWVELQIPQEAIMVQEFASLAAKIRNREAGPKKNWPEISRKTQVVLDAVNRSIQLGFKPVEL